MNSAITKADQAWWVLQHELWLLSSAPSEQQAASTADAIRDYVSARLAEHAQTAPHSGT